MVAINCTISSRICMIQNKAQSYRRNACTNCIKAQIVVGHISIMINYNTKKYWLQSLAEMAKRRAAKMRKIRWLHSPVIWRPMAYYFILEINFLKNIKTERLWSFMVHGIEHLSRRKVIMSFLFHLKTENQAVIGKSLQMGFQAVRISLLQAVQNIVHAALHKRPMVQYMFLTMPREPSGKYLTGNKQ